MLHGWSRNVENKSKMADGRHVEKLEKSRHLRHRLTDFDESWQGDASVTSATRRKFKIAAGWYLEKSKYHHVTAVV